MLRVVVDTSVLFPAFNSHRGYAHDLIMLAFQYQLAVVLSPYIFRETQRTFQTNASHLLGDVYEFIQKASVIPTGDPERDLLTKVEEYVVKKDAPVVALAIQEKADYLVSFDRKHILRDHVRQKSGLQIVTPDVVVTTVNQS